MKGLLLKDIINLKQQGKVYALIIAVWLVLAVMNRDGEFFSGVMMMMTMLVPMNAMAYDEKANWDKFALTMPVTRREIVLSKYVLMLGSALAGALLSELVNVVFTKDVQGSLITAVVFLSLGVALASFVLPLIFRFGIEKGRAIMILVILLPTAAVTLLSRLGVRLPDEEAVKRTIFFLPFAAAALAAASAAVSGLIYARKEL